MHAPVGSLTLAKSAPLTPETRAGLLLAPLLLAFVQLRGFVELVALKSPGAAFAFAAGAAVITAALVAAARYGELSRFNARFLRASALFLLFYFAIEPFTMPRPAFAPDHPAVLLHTHGRWAGLALGALGLWRPGFVAGGALLLFLMREMNGTLTGFYFSTLDIRVVAEVLLWMSVSACLLAGVMRWRHLRETLGLDPATERRLALFILAVGIGAHLGNYFWSAIAKLALDGGPLSWLLDNQLRDHMLGSVEKGALPYYASAALTQWAWDWMGTLNLPLQAASFALQLFALAAPLRRRWLMLATLGFDIFHLFIFASLGLFFFKWVCLNLIIMATLTAVREDEWDRPARRVCIAFVFGGALFFQTAMLAWYDSGNFAAAYFEAETDDGRRIKLPPGYFASASYQVSQAQLHWPAGSRHFAPHHWGSTKRFAEWDTQQRCALPAPKPAAPAQFATLDLLGRYAGEAHAIALARADADGRFDWRWYGHHHVPWPFVTEPIERQDIRRIRSYVYVLESICQTMRNGRVDRRVLLREEWPVWTVR